MGHVERHRALCVAGAFEQEILEPVQVRIG
jgi:hypothetical protein